jgi:hypothetical protein
MPPLVRLPAQPAVSGMGLSHGQGSSKTCAQQQFLSVLRELPLSCFCFRVRPLVNFFGGNDGEMLLSFNAFAATNVTRQNGVRMAAVDVNGDGKPDMRAAAGPEQPPEVRVFDAVSLALLDDFFAYDPSNLGGVFVGAGR